MNSFSGAELLSELEQREDTETAMAGSLVALEARPGFVRLSTVPPTGTTEAQWSAARQSMARLWSDFAIYQEVLRKARAVRDRRGRPNRADTEELVALLRRPTIEVSRTTTRTFTEQSEEVRHTTLAGLLERMEADFTRVDTLVTVCETRHDAYFAALTPLLDQLSSARSLSRDLADGSGIGPQAAELNEVGRLIDHLLAAADDPLGLPDDPTETVASVAGPMAAVVDALQRAHTERADWPRRRAAADDRITAVAELLGRERALRRRVVERIAGHGLTAPTDRVSVLRDRLDRVDSVSSWALRMRGMSEFEQVAADAEADVQQAIQRADGLLERRAELRGRYDGYQAKASRLGVVEHPAILDCADHIRGYLWSAPNDLAAATRALNTYRRILTELDGGGT